ncbi:hypothetical protein FHR61_000616 [Xanthomonas arboricola]|uniref:Uncharacterized protein n=1 Tax=Xanthomonas cannabis TaxID=1885674 RepID=A0ABR6JKG0_9XANT|nr:hypothetical protein [Xanthomonas cannabis]MBB5520820.1 hypothetical protein [Xanthomonas cannabis]
MHAAGLWTHGNYHCDASAAVTALTMSTHHCQLTLTDTPTMRGSLYTAAM